MKKTLLVALTGLSLTLVEVRQASAYCKFSFGVGFNVCFECGREGGRRGRRGDGNSDFLVGITDAPWAANLSLTPGVPCSKVDGAVPGFPQAPGIMPPADNTPRPTPNVMPPADHRPVGYFAQPQAENQDKEEESHYAPGYWYGR
jgi:hypothetical protein